MFSSLMLKRTKFDSIGTGSIKAPTQKVKLHTYFGSYQLLDGEKKRQTNYIYKKIHKIYENKQIVRIREEKLINVEKSVPYFKTFRNFVDDLKRMFSYLVLCV